MSEEAKTEETLTKEAPATPPAKTEEPAKEIDKEALAEQNRKAFDPGPEHPRFKEVWKKTKRLEEERADMAKDLDVIREHNKKLAERLEQIEKAKTEKEPDEPDPLTDPEGYKAYHKFQMAKKDKEFQEAIAKERIDRQIEVQKELHADYLDAVKVAERDMTRDAELQKKIWNSENPAKAAYQYGKGKMDEIAKADKDEEERQTRLEQADVVKPTPPPPKKEESDLTDDQRRVARRLFSELPAKEAETKYLKQLKAMGK
jgi:hypothetical protein